MYVALLSCPQSLNVLLLRHKSYLVFAVICSFIILLVLHTMLEVHCRN